MTFPRMDNIAIVVPDLQAAIAFFSELGLALDGQTLIEGLFADQCTGLKDVRSEIAMMKAPDNPVRLELTQYHRPKAIKSDPAALPPNTLGLQRVMFEVEDIDAMLARLRKQGAELVGDVANYENIYRLCYLRGPGGIIVALAQKVG
jgi:catechol 2,3-dioxygenase-like lactoylglutathione lyase family enzyme